MKYNAINGKGIEISVQHLPDRKKPCLCFERIGVTDSIILGYFRDDKSAELFIRAICNMTGTKIPDDYLVEVVD